MPRNHFVTNNDSVEDQQILMSHFADNEKIFSNEKIFCVEHTGFEPVTSTMRM